jgi:predicted DNA binding CopG/RHH family protein
MISAIVKSKSATFASEMSMAKFSQSASHGATVKFEFLALAIGEKESRFMKKKMVEYSKGEIGKVKIVKDFLPAPSELVLKDDNVKVTLSLSRRSIEFFKREAKQQRVPYQKMIRALVDGYAERVGK